MNSLILVFFMIIFALFSLLVLGFAHRFLSKKMCKFAYGFIAIFSFFLVILLSLNISYGDNPGIVKFKLSDEYEVVRQFCNDKDLYLINFEQKDVNKEYTLENVGFITCGFGSDSFEFNVYLDKLTYNIYKRKFFSGLYYKQDSEKFIFREVEE